MVRQEGRQIMLRFMLEYKEILLTLSVMLVGLRMFGGWLDRMDKKQSTGSNAA
jgi:hypothetical protein